MTWRDKDIKRLFQTEDLQRKLYESRQLICAMQLLDITLAINK